MPGTMPPNTVDSYPSATIKEPPPPLPPLPPIKLPPKWKCVRDKLGRPYYYHIKIRISQWEPPEFPPPTAVTVPVVAELVDSSSSSESSTVSEDSSTESDDDMDLDDTRLLLEIRKKLKMNAVTPSTRDSDGTQDDAAPVIGSETPKTNEIDEAKTENLDDVETEEMEPIVQLPTKRRRDALVQEIIISPRREEDKISGKEEAKRYRETKEKLRRRKEMHRAKERAERSALAKRNREQGSSSGRHHHHKSSHGNGKRKRSKKVAESAEGENAATPVEGEDMNSDAARKIKDNFLVSMAKVMVHILTAYKKSECKQGKITNTDDFKHLAKKLTHFVMLKELKHCRSVSDLTCTDSVKVKARDFVRKYMAKFGEVYQRPKDEAD